jgi:hypothetical protein
LTTNATLRALAYNSDFSQSGLGWPIAFTQIAGLRLTLAGELGGLFQLEASTNPTNWAALTLLTNSTVEPNSPIRRARTHPRGFIARCSYHDFSGTKKLGNCI